jgi:zinc protease
MTTFGRKAGWIGMAMVAAAAGARADETSAGAGKGFRFVVEQDPQSLLAEVRVVVRSGGLSDPARLPGLAHFTGRALLRGTKTRPYKDLTDAVERIGARLSVTVDAAQTTFRGEVIARNLDPFLDVLRDILTQPAFDAREMTLLQGILAGELKSRLQDPRAVAGRALLRAAYRGTPAEQPALGTVGAITRVSPQDAEQFFRARYVRENLVIGITSPLAPAEAERLLGSKLDSIPRGALDGPRLPAPSFKGRRAAIVEREGMSTVPLYVAVPGVGDGDAELPALEVGNFVFGADFTSRLVQVLRAQNGWTYGAYSSYVQLIPAQADGSLFSLYTYPSAEFAGRAIPKALQMLDEYASAGVTADEFAAARDALANRYPFEVDTAEKRLALRIREALNGRAYDTPEQYRQRLAALTREALNDAIARRTRTADAVIVAVGDAETLKPVLAALPFVESVEVLDVQP